MYRIELAPGEEALFRSIDELAKAIHSGVVGSHSRIWHSATNKWLPIDFHPHYKIARERPVTPAAKPAAAAPGSAQPAPSAPQPIFASPAPTPAKAPVAPSTPTVAPAQSVRTRELMFIELDPEPSKTAPTPSQVSALLFPEPPKPNPAPSPTVAPLFAEPVNESATPRHIEALVAMASSVPAVHVDEEPAEVMIDISRPPSRFSRRTVGAAAAGLFVVAGIGGALLARRAPAAPASPEIQVASTSLAATPASSFEVAANPRTPGDAPVSPQRTAAAEAPAKAVADTAKPVLPAAPTLAGSRAQLAIAESSLRDFNGEAESELEAKLRASGLTNLFAASRLTPEQIGSARVAVAGAANFVRAYRARVGDRESAEDRRAADALLADMASLLGTLGDNAGAYEVSGGAITFSDADLAREYGAVRRRLSGRLSADSGSAVAQTIIRVLGRSAPPEVM